MQKVLGCEPRLSRVVSSAVRSGLTAIQPIHMLWQVVPHRVSLSKYHLMFIADKLLCIVCCLNILDILLRVAMSCRMHGPGCSLITETFLTKTEESWKAHSPHMVFFTGIQRSIACSVWLLEQGASWARAKDKLSPSEESDIGVLPLFSFWQSGSATWIPKF